MGRVPQEASADRGFLHRLFGGFVIGRVVLLFVVALAVSSIPYRSFVAYTGLESVVPQAPEAAKLLLFPFANFDGIHYLQIAGQGYSDQYRFLPLYPSLIALPQNLFQLTTFSAGSVIIALLICTMATLVGSVFFYKLLRLDYSAKESERSVWFLLAFPTAFFLSCVYTEALFFLLSILALYLARTGKWGWAVVCAMLLSVTRLTGVLIALPLAMEYLAARAPAEFNTKTAAQWFKDYIQKLIRYTWWIPLVCALPVVLYALYNYSKTGDALFFVHGHGQLANGRSVTSLVFPLQTAVRYLRILIRVPMSLYEFWLALLEVLSTIAAGTLLVQAYRVKVRASLVVFGMALWVVPVLSGTLSGMPRYIVLLFPMYVVLAKLVPPQRAQFALAIMFVAQLLLATLFARGYLIG